MPVSFYLGLLHIENVAVTITSVATKWLFNKTPIRFLSKEELKIQWTLTYPTSFYANTRIIQTACFNHYVIKNCIVLLHATIYGHILPRVLYMYCIIQLFCVLCIIQLFCVYCIIQLFCTRGAQLASYG